MRRQHKAYLLAVTVVLCWATIGSAFKLTLQHVTPHELLLYALPVALLTLSAVLTVRRRWGAVAATTRRELLHSALLGLLNPFLYYLVLLRAYSLLPAQEASVLNFTWPITLVLLSAILLGQRLTVKTVLALLLGFTGVYLIAARADVVTLLRRLVTGGAVFPFRFESPLGVALALGSTVIWASFWIFNLKDPRDGAVKLFLNLSFGLLFVLLTWPILGRKALPPAEGLLGATYAGVFEWGIPYLLWFTALSYARRTADVANFIFLSPFLSLCCIHLTVGERILPSTIQGLALVVAAIALQQWGGQARDTANAHEV